MSNYQSLTPISYVGLVLPFTQNEWAFDAINGDNINNKGDRSAPLKDWNGYFNRVGFNPKIDISTDYYLLSDIDEIDFTGHQLGIDGSIHFHGSPTIIRSGTITSVNQRNPLSLGGGNALEISDGLYDWTTDIGKLIEINAGDPNGPVRCIVLAALSSPNRARLSAPSTRSPGDPYNLLESFVVGIGQSYSIKRLPKINELLIPNYLAFGTKLGPNYFELCDLSSPEQINISTGQIYFYDCLTGLAFLQNTVQASLLNCLITSDFDIQSSVGGMAYGGILNSSIFLYNSQVTFINVTLQNSKFLTSQGGGGLGSIITNHHASFGLGIFDSTAPINLGPSGQFLSESSIYGTGNKDCIIKLHSGGQFRYYNSFSANALYATGGGVGYNDIKINDKIQLPAMDPTSYALTAPRNLTFALLGTSVAGGGFEGNMFDPRDPLTGIFQGDGT